MPDKPDIGLLIDTICNEFEEQWSPDARSDFEPFLARLEEQHRVQLLQMLLEVDVELRGKAGQDVSAEDYAELGVQAADHVGRLLTDTNGDATFAPVADQDNSTRSAANSSRATDAPRQIGPYKLLQKIGEGGMGTVWMAQQEKPVRRRVALKLIRADLASKEIIARFEAERQALAMMDHQNIAKVLDAGTTERGSPYFVMELVKGISLTQYCDDNKLSIKDRLELFVPVCKAVQHAHQKGIIHRDLKPSNVLVTLYDGEPVAKVIDFGLAKALEHTTKLTDKTMFTEFGKVVGTLQYMAPEQAEMNALDVDTRADIYSLGVMLYELLTGSTPLDKDTLGKHALLQVLKLIRDEEPPRPSTRLSSSGDAADGISLQRKIAPAKLQQILRGELDWVVMKALEKDRSRRYETANDFAQDVDRYLKDEAVQARPPSVTYKARKFIRKNRVPLTTVASILVVAVVSASLWRYSIDSERKRNQLYSNQRNAKGQVDVLELIDGNVIPLILDNLDELPPDLVLKELQDRFLESTGQPKLSLAYGLANFDQVEIDAIIAGLISDDTESEEVNNIVEALRGDKTESLTRLKTAANAASKNQNWQIKVRLAIVALHLGDQSLAADMLRDEPESTAPKIKLSDLVTDFRKLIEQITKLPDEERSAGHNRYKLASAYYFLDQDNQALVELELLTSGDSADDLEVGLQAICQARVGKADDARESLSKITRNQGTDFYASILVEAWLGNLKKAEDRLYKAIDNRPDSFYAKYEAAKIAAQLVRVCRQKNLPGEERFKRVALQQLRLAYKGNDNPGRLGIENDGDFIPLRNDQDFLSLGRELMPTFFDPIQRLVFIREFGDWSGLIEPLAAMVANINNRALRSGICLSVGGVANPSQSAKEKWQPNLEDWYSKATDSGTHSAAGWALSQWNMQKPEIVASKQTPSDRHWWHEPNGLRFVKVSAGKCISENRLIVVDDEYWLSDSEINVGLFKKFMGDDEYHQLSPKLKPDWSGVYIYGNDDSPDLPVQQVSWYDAVMFCNWLSWKLDLEPCYQIEKSPPEPDSGQGRQHDQDPGRSELREPFVVTWQQSANGIRLPTSAEWENACRAATTTRFSFGNDEIDLVDYAWFTVNSNGETHSSRQKLCNAWGLFDMHGNVWERCWDDKGSGRMSHGGSWDYGPMGCWSSSGGGDEPTARDDNLGFRVARGPSSHAEKTGK